MEKKVEIRINKLSTHLFRRLNSHNNYYETKLILDDKSYKDKIHLSNENPDYHTRPYISFDISKHSLNIVCFGTHSSLFPIEVRHKNKWYNIESVNFIN